MKVLETSLEALNNSIALDSSAGTFGATLSVTIFLFFSL